MSDRELPFKRYIQPKRRKVRKGTQSCWECKRRKIRCTFANPTESVCDGCRSRQVKCVSQEYDNQSEAPRHKAERLDRGEQSARRAESDIPESISADASTVSEAPNSFLSRSKTGLNTGLIVGNSDNDLRNALTAAWPSQHDLVLITSIPVGTSVLFHGTVCMPYSTLLDKGLESPRDMLQLPSPGSHPVLIVRKLLLLGSFLQGIPPGAIENLRHLDSEVSQVMSRVMETASRLVTSNDDLVESLEGIECIMIESMYHNNAGNLRRAWQLNRRAITIAEMMGLHLDQSPLAKMLDKGTRERINPQSMWFRLITSDRYLSLMLGLPQASPESPFATSKALENCAPLDRMERIEATVGGLILQRNAEDLHNMHTTDRIDTLLQEAAAGMPAQWWLTPDISVLAGPGANGLSETLRLMNQFTHYHLLAQLHLPYMLQPSNDPRYSYSKITAVNASREVLARFVLFRSADTIPAYCRGIDFLAFIASTILCLAHIHSRRQDQANHGKDVNVFNFLKHQRPGDRGLLERTLAIMERMAETRDDTISHRIASILKHLLVVEVSGPQGYSVETSISPQAAVQDFPCGESLIDGSSALMIQVPYFGTIKVDHTGELRTGISGSSLNCDGSSLASKRFHSTAFPIASVNDNALAGIAREAEPFHPDCVELDGGLNPTVVTQDHGPSEQDALESINPSVLDLDDWTLQGVDTALFDSLIRGSEPTVGD